MGTYGKRDTYSPEKQLPLRTPYIICTQYLITKTNKKDHNTNILKLPPSPLKKIVSNTNFHKNRVLEKKVL